MPDRSLRFRSAVVGMCLCAIVTGCKDIKLKPLSLKLKKEDDEPKIVIPSHIKGTIAEFASLVGGNIPVQAHGIVIGLGDNGSSEVPPHLRRSITEYLYKSGLQSPRLGTQRLIPRVVLKDKDTAIVLVGGAVPPGAPIGARFDLSVAALAQTQTRSLDGGALMPIDLRLAYGRVATPHRTTQVLGAARGPIFVNPLIDPTRPEDAAKLKIGRIIGGGKVIVARPLRLQLHHPSYQMADRIQREIIGRFSSEQDTLLARVAKARSRSVVEIRIPPEWRKEYRYFLNLVMHLPVRYRGGSPEAHARWVAAQMEMPTANHSGLALVWEAMGRSVVPLARELYGSANAGAAFHAARAGMRLDDALAEDVLIRFASRANSPYQIPAIRELARRGQITRALPMLRKLVDDSNARVRIAAYEALLRIGDLSTVTTVDIPRQFKVDLVRTRGGYTIYATRTIEPRIVLFGRDMPVRKPIFFESAGELVTINAFGDSNTMTVFRKIPRYGMISDPFEVDFTASSLIETLGTVPVPDRDGKVFGLGLTYGQVVGILYRMCKEGDIPAEFVLQPVEGMRRIYTGSATVGRPDTPTP